MHIWVLDFAESIQDIAPTYYDISTFKKGEVKNALIRTMDRVRRKEAIKGLVKR